MLKQKFIPWAKPIFWGKEKTYINNALNSTWISGGEYIEKFEGKLKKFLKIKNIHCVTNGTAALQACFLALEIKYGDEVIIPSFGYMAAANISTQMGINPIFCDVDKETWCQNVTHIESLITKKTKAIVLIHNYGNMCEVDEIIALGRKYKIPIIEDSAEAFGSKYKGKYSGSFGSLSTFSFHATKLITTGEGGAVVCKDKEYSSKIQLYRNHGVLKKRYWHLIPGNNFRMTNFQAAMGYGQIEKIETIMKKKINVYNLYKKHLSKIDGIKIQEITKMCSPIIWAMGIRIIPKAFKFSRDSIIKSLLQDRIETRRAFFSSNELSHIFKKQDNLSNSYALSKNILVLPSSPDLDEEIISFICENIKKLKK